MTHSEMCKLAVMWLKRPYSRGGHGCKVAIDECQTGWSGEIPDAIGYCSTGQPLRDGTVLVECKVSRADFLADRTKPHRQAGGVGNWRYFMAPEGLIKLDELPQKWGLVEVNARGHLKLRRGVYIDSNYVLQGERLVSMRHESDMLREQFLIVRMFDRIADPEKMIDMGKERNRLSFRVNSLSAELLAAQRKTRELGLTVSELENELGRYRAIHGSLPAVEALRQIT
jgi:hypothetical protein